MTNGKGTLDDQDVAYILQVLTTRPLGEALPLWLRLTGQQLVPVAPTTPPAPPQAPA